MKQEEFEYLQMVRHGQLTTREISLLNTILEEKIDDDKPQNS